MTASLKYLLSLSLVLLKVSLCFGEASEEEMNKSNNPLTPMAGLVLQDYSAPELYGSDETTNSFLMRGTLPFVWKDIPQLSRVTIPYNTVPSMDGEDVSALGDINIFDIFLTGTPRLQLGIGPYLVLPTASKDETGAGKWQIGAAGVVMAPMYWGLLGALLTYQHDFAGDSDRPTQNIFTAQPFVIYNLPHAFYLRSVGIWYFNWENGDYYIPVGFGAGKVWKRESGTTVNLYLEPQWTVAHEGDGHPKFQYLFGINFQYPLGTTSIVGRND
ncbi:hypothetical protein [Bdellovibrio sp. HCB337]|uniref:hypothetical protein n=1 Tax=Bdellovibrio sp. HCB337 TaxID=3394358 RepID=UPI0039A4CD0B